MKGSKSILQPSLYKNIISNAVNRTEYSSDTNTNTYLNFAMLEKVTPIILF